MQRRKGKEMFNKKHNALKIWFLLSEMISVYHRVEPYRFRVDIHSTIYNLYGKQILTAIIDLRATSFEDDIKIDSLKVESTFNVK